MIRSVSRWAALVAVGLVAVSCHSDKSTGPGGGNSALGSYYGVFGASNGSVSVGGTIVIVITSSGATGTLTPTGSAGINLTGTYNSGSGAVSVTGGGHTLTGTVSNGTLDGTYTGPAGSGSFGSEHGAAPTDVKQFCGSYTGASSGVWNLAMMGNSLAGAYADDGGGSAQLKGTVSGTTLSITFSGGTAAGTLASATTMNGTWTAGANSGTWAGVSPCP
jgi:hypothetical protein